MSYSSINWIAGRVNSNAAVQQLSTSERSVSEEQSTFWENVETVGDIFATPGRLFFGANYNVTKVNTTVHECSYTRRIEGNQLEEIRPAILDLSWLPKGIFLLLFPISIISTTLGLLFKNIAIASDAEIAKKYQQSSYILPPVIRTPK